MCQTILKLGPKHKPADVSNAWPPSSSPTSPKANGNQLWTMPRFRLSSPPASSQISNSPRAADSHPYSHTGRYNMTEPPPLPSAMAALAGLDMGSRSSAGGQWTSPAGLWATSPTCSWNQPATPPGLGGSPTIAASNTNRPSWTTSQPATIASVRPGVGAFSDPLWAPLAPTPPGLRSQDKPASLVLSSLGYGGLVSRQGRPESASSDKWRQINRP